MTVSDIINVTRNPKFFSHKYGAAIMGATPFKFHADTVEGARQKALKSIQQSVLIAEGAFDTKYLFSASGTTFARVFMGLDGWSYEIRSKTKLSGSVCVQGSFSDACAEAGLILGNYK